MNLAVAVMACVMSFFIGLKAYLVVQVGVSTLAGAPGIWLFYVQHQFEGAYWERRDQWNYAEAALQGSSFYKLPRILQWFSGNIGFHHMHWLRNDTYARASGTASSHRPCALRTSSMTSRAAPCPPPRFVM
jgi:acyl-lipid omega-6 desaturase (Delta-12 desaturase)